jgi:membrane fusion protein (multidrug efflux system)
MIAKTTMLFSGKEVESQVRSFRAAAKATAFKISVIVANSKVSGKQTDVAAANIKRAKSIA